MLEGFLSPPSTGRRWLLTWEGETENECSDSHEEDDCGPPSDRSDIIKIDRQVTGPPVCFRLEVDRLTRRVWRQFCIALGAISRLFFRLVVPVRLW